MRATRMRRNRRATTMDRLSRLSKADHFRACGVRIARLTKPGGRRYPCYVHDSPSPLLCFAQTVQGRHCHKPTLHRQLTSMRRRWSCPRSIAIGSRIPTAVACSAATAWSACTSTGRSGRSCCGTRTYGPAVRGGSWPGRVADYARQRGMRDLQRHGQRLRRHAPVDAVGRADEPLLRHRRRRLAFSNAVRLCAGRRAAVEGVQQQLAAADRRVQRRRIPPTCTWRPGRGWSCPTSRRRLRRRGLSSGGSER